MEIVALSDTHGKHRLVTDVPDGDVLVHAGDMTKHGKVSEVEDFAEWFGQHPHDFKIVVAGNHDFCFDGNQKEKAVQALKDQSIVYLEEETIVLQGVTFYGSPYSNTFEKYVFNEGIGRIPEKTDVLITHGPPKHVNDYMEEFGHVGSEQLAEKVEELDLEAHIYGHVHEHYGAEDNSINVSVLDIDYKVAEQPFELQVNA